MNSPKITELKIPEYKYKDFPDKSVMIEYNITPQFKIEIPKVYLTNKPDFNEIGNQIDSYLKDSYHKKHIAVRVLNSKDHYPITLTNLITKIKNMGHDRYDPNRAGDRYRNIENKKIDIFALDFIVEKSGTYFAQLLEPYYFWPLADGKEPEKIDLILIYDINELSRVIHHYEGRENETKKDGFVFNNNENKKKALLEIILLKEN